MTTFTRHGWGCLFLLCNKKFLFYIVFIAFFIPNAISQNCARSLYRTIDGTCNNLGAANQYYGAAEIDFFRELPALYGADDTNNSLSFPNRPNPRLISNEIFDQTAPTGNPDNLSSFVFTWAQFLDHDITLTKEATIEPVPIPLPNNEPLFTSPIRFSRSAFIAGTGITSPRQQENELTAWIDGSQVYGSDEARANWLRTFQFGKLKTSAGNLLPYNTINAEANGTIDPNAPPVASIDGQPGKSFVAGDVRATEQPNLTALHILFVREHNRICDELISQGYRNDEEIYQIARKQVGALMQVITYEEFLPALKVQLASFRGYNHAIRPDIMNLFATAAFRIGHTMVADKLLIVGDNCEKLRTDLTLAESFFNNSFIKEFDIDPFLKGMSTQQQETIDAQIVDGLRNSLFALPQLPNAIGLDLASINIQRGRDHGLPDYNTVRRYFRRSSANSFFDINRNPNITNQLSSVYNDVNSIDLWVGLLAEEVLLGNILGPTMHNVLKVQFERLRDGDFYYYENDPFYSFSDRLTLKNTKLSDIIKRNTNLQNLQADVFHADACELIASVNCDAVNVSPLNSAIVVSNLTAPQNTVEIIGQGTAWQTRTICNQNCPNTVSISDLPAGDYTIKIQQLSNDDYCFQERAVTFTGGGNVCTIDAGNISTQDATTFCINDPISPIQVSLNSNSTTGNSAWIITNDQHQILDLPFGTSFNPAIYGIGSYQIYHIQFESGLSGLNIGNNINALQGCFDLSNSIAFVVQSANQCNTGGSIVNCDAVTISSTDGSIIVSNLNAPQNIVDIIGAGTAWQIRPICSQNCPSTVSISDLPAGDYTVKIQQLGNNDYCYQERNITLTEGGGTNCNITGGNISTQAATDFCIGEFNAPIQVSLNSNSTTGNSAWIITNTQQQIFGLPFGPPFNPEAYGVGNYQIYHIQYESGLSGLNIGASINALQGCFDLSNAIGFSLQSANQCNTGGNANCDAVNVSSTNGGIEITGLNASFTTIKIFDINASWQIVGSCAGNDCSVSEVFNVSPGNYNVEVVFYQGPWANEVCRRLIPINVEQRSLTRNSDLAINARLFPNPVLDNLFIDLKDYADQPAILQLVDISGKAIKQWEFNQLPSDLVQLELNDIANGWYFLNIKVPHKKPLTKKVVVNRLY